MAADPLRLGILGAARIAPLALVRPARRVPGATVLAVAARDPARARHFATRQGIPRVHPTYDALLADPEIEAIYNPLPNALHARWTIRALAADLRFADGRTARLTCSLFSRWLVRASAKVEGSAGRLLVLNPFAPQYFHRLRVVTAAGSRRERVAGGATYDYQLRAFVA